nr:hypothetical protein [Candidatus Woesearchaeota archaeon]
MVYDDNYDIASKIISGFNKAVGIGFLVFVLGGGCGSYTNSHEYSNGIRTGMINKISKKGLIWKTYEGQMALEGIVSDGQRMGANVWDFSIDNQARNKENIEELAKKAQEYLESGTQVKVRYREVLWGWPWRGSTDYYIQAVEPVEKK